MNWAVVFLRRFIKRHWLLSWNSQEIPFVREKGLRIEYKQRVLQTRYRADFIAFDEIIIEVKATDALVSNDSSQVLNYLNATNYKLGILVNFGADAGIESKRLVL
jgi:GxxExxY protein